LYEGERILLIPGPEGGIEGLAALAFLRGASPSKDVADSVRRKAEAVVAEVEGQSQSSILGLLPGVQYLLLDVRRGPSRGMVRATGAVIEPGKARCLEAREPFADHLSRGAPATGSVADVARLRIGCHCQTKGGPNEHAENS